MVPSNRLLPHRNNLELKKPEGHLIQGELLLRDELLQNAPEPDSPLFQVIRQTGPPGEVRIHVLAMTAAKPGKTKVVLNT
jgi:hypothetical protein